MHLSNPQQYEHWSVRPDAPRRPNGPVLCTLLLETAGTAHFLLQRSRQTEPDARNHLQEVSKTCLAVAGIPCVDTAPLAGQQEQKGSLEQWTMVKPLEVPFSRFLSFLDCNRTGLQLSEKRYTMLISILLSNNGSCNASLKNKMGV